MVRLADASTSPLSIATELTQQGLQVFPAPFKGKAPLVDWKKYQRESASPMLKKWFGGERGHLNFWVLTGSQSGYLVVDCDSPEGEAWWRERINDEMDAT